MTELQSIEGDVRARLVLVDTGDCYRVEVLLCTNWTGYPGSGVAFDGPEFSYQHRDRAEAWMRTAAIVLGGVA